MTLVEQLEATVGAINGQFVAVLQGFGPFVQDISDQIAEFTDNRATVELRTVERRHDCTIFDLTLLIQGGAPVVVETIAAMASGSPPVRVKDGHGDDVSTWQAIADPTAANAYLLSLAADPESSLVRSLAALLRPNL